MSTLKQSQTPTASFAISSKKIIQQPQQPLRQAQQQTQPQIQTQQQTQAQTQQQTQRQYQNQRQSLRQSQPQIKLTKETKLYGDNHVISTEKGLVKNGEYHLNIGDENIVKVNNDGLTLEKGVFKQYIEKLNINHDIINTKILDIKGDSQLMMIKINIKNSEINTEENVYQFSGNIYNKYITLDSWFNISLLCKQTSTIQMTNVQNGCLSFTMNIVIINELDATLYLQIL